MLRGESGSEPVPTPGPTLVVSLTPRGSWGRWFACLPQVFGPTCAPCQTLAFEVQGSGLRIETVDPNDVYFYATLFGDAPTVAWFATGEIRGRPWVDRLMERYQKRLRGNIPWAGLKISRAGGDGQFRPIGHIVLGASGDGPTTGELALLIARDERGGLAREGGPLLFAAIAHLIALGFRFDPNARSCFPPQLQEIMCTVHPCNLHERAILENLGFKPDVLPSTDAALNRVYYKPATVTDDVSDFTNVETNAGGDPESGGGHCLKVVVPPWANGDQSHARLVYRLSVDALLEKVARFDSELAARARSAQKSTLTTCLATAGYNASFLGARVTCCNPPASTPRTDVMRRGTAPRLV